MMGCLFNADGPSLVVVVVVCHRMCPLAFLRCLLDLGGARHHIREQMYTIQEPTMDATLQCTRSHANGKMC